MEYQVIKIIWKNHNIIYKQYKSTKNNIKKSCNTNSIEMKWTYDVKKVEHEW